jgi:hypothetical protein
MTPTRLLRTALTALFALLLATVLAPAAGTAAPSKADGGIRFTYLDPNAGAVSLAGEFNGWSTSATPLTKGADGTWSVVVPFAAGRHQYKFVVDGQWIADPENGATAGEFGNSVIEVDASGGLVQQRATSNTAYSPKIFVGGRVIGLYHSLYSGRFDRMELARPNLDLDLGFDVRVSDAVEAKVLMNINPEYEDVQDYRSRLNFKRGSLVLTRPSYTLRAYDSENIGTWDDPLHLVGDIGPFRHPWGYERQGVQFQARPAGFDLEFQFSDNFNQDETNSDRFLGYRIDNFPTFQIPEGQSPRFVFESDPIGKALALIQTVRSGADYAMVADQASKVQTLDFGDNGRLFGYGDNFEDVFAARIRRALTPELTVGALGRTDRGFGLGRLVRAEPAADSVVRILNALYDQQWYGGGVEAAWTPRDGVRLHAELLAGARRMNFVNGSNELLVPLDSILSTRVVADRTSASSRNLDGTHEVTDESLRWTVGGSWTFARGDITVRGELERETHDYPAWTQEPIIPAGLPPTDAARFETVFFQRATYLDASKPVENAMTALRLGWDRNWRHYLNREVTTALDVEWVDFDYDPRTSWEHQLWFPTGSFWLEHGGYRVGVDRLTVLGSDRAVRIRPRVDVPVWSSRNGRLAWLGTFSGVDLDKAPRYAESVLQFGLDLTRTVRLQSDTRWVKYDAPVLNLDRGWVSQFTEAVVRVAPGVEVALGLGIDPWVIDPNTNEYDYVGRDVFLNERGASGYYAETNYLSGGPVLRSAEQALQDQRRVQLEAIIRF